MQHHISPASKHSPKYYIEHISLAIKHKDDSMFRGFIDRWYCLKNGYVSKYGNPNWHKIIGKEYVSRGYKETNIDLNKNEPYVHKEHIVPIKVISKELIALKDHDNLDKIEQILMKLVQFATILKSEDKRLTRSSMPEGYNYKKNVLHWDVFARYKEAKIELYKFDKQSKKFIKSEMK